MITKVHPMKLISEINEENEIISEDIGGGKKQWYIRGINLQAEVKNRNGRIYPKNVMHEEVTRYIREHIDTNRAVGELGHPPNPQINLDKISHRIISLKEDGNDYIGNSLILNTPNGNIARGLLEGGMRLGTSSRALGSLVEGKGAKIVQSDFRLVTPSDIVADPSAPSAFVNGIMEGVDFWFDEHNRIIAERPVEEAQEKIEEATRSRLLRDPEHLFKIFESMLVGINEQIDLCLDKRRKSQLNK